MVRERAEIQIFATLSKHNDSRDLQDEATWAQLKADVAKLLESDKYENICPQLY